MGGRPAAAIDTDKLPVQQYLVLEVLAARHRTGEATWTFPTRVRWALLHLADLGLIGYKSGGAPRTYLAWLTHAGREAALSDTYKPPAERPAWVRRTTATGGGPCPTCGRPLYVHVCLSCSPDSQTPGPGCTNCRDTGMDQTPCRPASDSR